MSIQKLRLLGGTGLLVLSILGCATQKWSLAGLVMTAHAQAAKKSTIAVPPNYRELAARKILETWDRKQILSARISGPYQEWAGILAGGMRPAVCAEVIRASMLPGGRDVWAFTFQNGVIDKAWYSKSDCKALMPFRELMPRK